MNNSECISNVKERTNQIIYSRNIPDQPLQPYLDVKPVSTKYSLMPIVDPRKESNVNLINCPMFNPHEHFNPGTSKAPWSGYASKINTESELKNQIYALQKCSQSVYIPNSNSDLYEYKYKPHNIVSNPHELLFRQNDFNLFNPNPDSNVIGHNLFNNSTREQLKDIHSNKKC